MTLIKCHSKYMGLVGYQQAYDLQQIVAAQVADRTQTNTLLLLEHPHVYTLGRRAKESDVLLDQSQLAQRGVQVISTDRGGETTYHGPGQLVGYPILDLRKLNMGPLKYVRSLEEVIIRTLADFGIQAGRIEKLTGVWVGNSKIAAIGVRISRGVTTHGFALNVSPDISYFGGIIPCGIIDKSVTSMAQCLGQAIQIRDVAPQLVNRFAQVLDLEMSYSGLMEETSMTLDN